MESDSIWVYTDGGHNKDLIVGPLYIAACNWSWQVGTPLNTLEEKIEALNIIESIYQKDPTNKHCVVIELNSDTLDRYGVDTAVVKGERAAIERLITKANINGDYFLSSENNALPILISSTLRHLKLREYRETHELNYPRNQGRATPEHLDAISKLKVLPHFYLREQLIRIGIY